MALEINITKTSTGHANKYWRVTRVSIDAIAGFARVEISGYAGEEARQEGKEPDDKRAFDYAGDDFLALASTEVSGTLYNAIATACYARIVQSPEFVGAIDV